MTSKKQIAANRENAKKAGVRTSEGKSVSRMNAIKHGILSSHLLLEDEEDGELFEELRDQMLEEFQPVGTVEMILVDRLFSTYWRLQRVVRAECAVIEESRIVGRIRQATAYIQKPVNYDRFPDAEDTTRLEKYRTSLVCVELITDVRQIIHFIENDYLPLPKILRDRLQSNFGVAHQLSPLREEILVCDEAIEKKEYHGKDEAHYKYQILNAAKQMLDLLKERAMDFATLEDHHFSAEQKAQILPGEQDAQRIQRYETHLHRMFMQTLHELQRIQSVRLGKPGPMSAALDVTLADENGFVS